MKPSPNQAMLRTAPLLRCVALVSLVTIVRTGPYRFTRNPMYLSLCLAQVAIAFVVDDWVALLLVIPLALILHFGVVVREERYLEAKFGAQYLALKKEVRRWI